jgi:hypothetical protein
MVGCILPFLDIDIKLNAFHFLVLGFIVFYNINFHKNGILKALLLAAKCQISEKPIKLFLLIATTMNRNKRPASHWSLLSAHRCSDVQAPPGVICDPSSPAQACLGPDCFYRTRCARPAPGLFPPDRVHSRTDKDGRWWAPPELLTVTVRNLLPLSFSGISAFHCPCIKWPTANEHKRE